MIKNELPKTELRLSDFYYDLPKEMIAQTPVEPRELVKTYAAGQAPRVKSNTKYSVISPTI